ncbi:MAG: fructose-1,6-bisphosphatase I [Colwellia polaris]|jgi:fructose-1,6-bisphosphatase I
MTIEDRIFEEVARTAPEISSGMLRRREGVGEENSSGEEQLEADLHANRLLKERLTALEGVGQFASEEEEDVIECGEGVSVTVDPLDGSSNVKSNNLTGTIVAIYNEELPAPGHTITSAFYIVYGPLTTAIRSKDDQVHEHVIEDHRDGVKIHTLNEGLELPEPKVYGFGGGDDRWTSDFASFADEIRQEMKLRYGGAFVGDTKQILKHGGMFSYPHLEERPEGKLRLIFEANPMAHIFHNAGGASSDGERSILEKEPEHIHERTPVHVGNRELIERLESHLEG